MIEECPLCGSTDIATITRVRRITVNGNDLVMPDDRITRCNGCSEMYYIGEQWRVADRKLIDARRRAEGLLTSQSIRELRDSLKLSQSELEQTLGTGPKTVVRWENGTAVQSKAADDVLRLLALDPDNLRLLVRVRESALATVIDQRLEPERIKTNLRLENTLSTALKTFKLGPTLTAQIVEQVCCTIQTSKTKQIERAAKSP